MRKKEWKGQKGQRRGFVPGLVSTLMQDPHGEGAVRGMVPASALKTETIRTAASPACPTIGQFDKSSVHIGHSKLPKTAAIEFSHDEANALVAALKLRGITGDVEILATP